MKFEITVVDDLKIEASSRNLSSGDGMVLEIYFFSGHRYEHFVGSTSIGQGEFTCSIEDEEGDYKGVVKFIGETPEEIALLSNNSEFSGRNKETVSFLFLKRNVLATDQKSFQCERNFS